MRPRDGVTWPLECLTALQSGGRLYCKRAVRLASITPSAPASANSRVNG
jgi:hypothetical protein